MWSKLVGDSLVRPRMAARTVMALELAPGVLWQAALAVACIGVILGFGALLLAGSGVDPMSAALFRQPLLGAAMQFAVILAVGYATFRIGRACGGRGGLGDAVALVVWLNAMMAMVQVAQLAALALMPPLGAVLAVATIAWALWAFANFVAELHDFENAFFVLGGVILTLILAFFAIAMVLALLGMAPQEPV